MFLHSLDLSAPPHAIKELIAKDRLLEGEPVTISWALDTPFEGLYCGIWCCTEGAFRIHYDEWEYCRLHEGLIEIIDNNDQSRRFGPGDEFVLEPGFVGIWRTIKPCKKTYVIKTP
jgi:uncharacterized protein